MKRNDRHSAVVAEQKRCELRDNLARALSAKYPEPDTRGYWEEACAKARVETLVEKWSGEFSEEVSLIVLCERDIERVPFYVGWLCDQVS